MRGLIFQYYLYYYGQKQENDSLAIFAFPFVYSNKNSWLYRASFKVREKSIKMVSGNCNADAKHTYIPGGLVVKYPPANAGGAGDAGLISGSGWFPEGGNGHPLQCSWLENSMDKGA